MRTHATRLLATGATEVALCLFACMALSLTLASCGGEGSSPAAALAPGIASAERLPEDATWEWTPGANCAPCHAAESASMDAIPCVDASVETQTNPIGKGARSTTTPPKANAETSAESACLTCHTNITGLTHAHSGIENAKPSSKLRSTVMADVVCEGCHDASTLATRTASSTALTDAYGTVVNPHDVKTSHNAKGQHSDMACADCHKLHATTTDVAETAADTCTSCHHAGVYQCGTCHN